MRGPASTTYAISSSVRGTPCPGLLERTLDLLSSVRNVIAGQRLVRFRTSQGPKGEVHDDWEGWKARSLARDGRVRAVARSCCRPGRSGRHEERLDQVD